MRSVGSNHVTWLLAMAAVGLLGGCVDEDPSGPTDASVDQSVVVIDAETDGPGPEADLGIDAGLDGATPDAMSPADAGPDGEPADGSPGDMAPAPDQAMGRMIDTCEAACGRYLECERIDDEFGDLDACLRDCERVSRGGRPDDWFDCVELESCNLLRLCPVPPIEPLGCDEVCGLVDACGVDLALPDCMATCEENAEPFRACGDLLYGGVCDGAGFGACVVDRVFPECRTLCDVGVGCNLVRGDACIADCLDDRLSGDPLGALRSSQVASCVRFAGEDCAATDACFFPDDEIGGPPDPVRFCELYAGCDFGIFFSCQEALQELGDQLACGVATLENGCPFDEFDLLDTCFFGQGPDPRAEPCNRLCEARDVCGDLPEGQNRLGCSQACLGQGGADPDGQARADSVLPCGAVDRCDDLRECLAASGPAVECDAFCDNLAGCDLADGQCPAACDADWPRDRHAAWRACVAGAGDDCAAMAGCEPPPPPPCQAYCDRVGPADCFVQDDGGGCVGRCDDAHFADPAGALSSIACVLTAPVCFGGEIGDDGIPHDVEACIFRGARDGIECLGFCRATTECAGDPAGLAECLVDCGAGLVGDDGLRFLAGRDCLGGLPGDAACAAVQACVPPTADADCPALCDRAAGCGIDLAECPARCVDDPLARLRALRGEVCITPEAECDAVDACILPPLFDPDVEDPGPQIVGQAAFCAAFDACDSAELNFGECDFIYQDLVDFGGPEGPACGVRALQICSPFLDEIFDCFDGGEPAPPNPLIEPCAVLCEARRFCDAEPEAQRVCELGCQDQYRQGDRDSLIRVVPQMRCGSTWSCPELAECLDAASPEAICAARCAAGDACGAVPDVGDCEARCLADFPRAREISRRDCLAGIDPADCAARAACEPPRPLPCDLACASLDACGLGIDRCVPTCDDAGFADPAGEAQRIACLVAAGDDCAAVAACQDNPGAGGGACFAWCRATTECDPAADEDLPTCLTRCLVGFDDGDALRFGAAEACLDAVGAAGDCGDLLACVPAEPVVDCDRFCGALDDCRVPTDDCPGACAAAPDVDRAICVADALRTGQRCAGVAACVDYVPPPADAVCRGLCERITGCDDAVDPFLCRLDCTPTPAAAAFQLACARFAGCDAQLDACLALDDTPIPACVDICEPAVDACGLYPDAPACIAECSGREASPQTDESYLDRAAACFDDGVVGGICDRDAVGSCLQPASCDLRDDLIFFAGPAGQIDTDTSALPDVYDAPCAGGGAAEQIIVINIPTPSQLVAEIIDGDYDTSMNIRAPCDEPALACDDDGGFDLLSRLDLELEPGTYYLFVEGYGGDVGRATVDIRIVPR